MPESRTCRGRIEEACRGSTLSIDQCMCEGTSPAACKESTKGIRAIYPLVVGFPNSWNENFIIHEALVRLQEFSRLDFSSREKLTLD